MFQHIVVTPKDERRGAAGERDEPEEVDELSLAPFTPVPKLSFDDVEIGATITKRLLIRNPTAVDVMLHLQKAPPAERNVTFSWKECVIHAASYKLFEITWMPQVVGAWRDIIQLSDGGRIRRDVPIAFKSAWPAVRKKKVSISVKVKKAAPVRRSPKRHVSSTDMATSAMPGRVCKGNNVPQIKVLQPPSPARRSTYNVQNKENFPSLQSGKTNRYMDHTYTINKTRNPSLTSPPKRSAIAEAEAMQQFDDSLEGLPLMGHKQESFNISWSDLCTPNKQAPSFYCSTGERSLGNSQFGNTSAETYSKGNTSGGTYVKDTPLNTSGGTYVKGNVSGGTYVKDSSIANLADLRPSPLERHVGAPKSPKKFTLSNFVFSPCIETSPLAHHALGKISEESSIELTPVPARRKRRSSEQPRQVSLTYEVHISPLKKALKKVSPRRSPAKRLAKGYGTKPLNLRRFLPPPAASVGATAVTITSAHNPALFYNNVCNPYVLAQTSGVDPFIAATVYYDPRWVQQQIVRFSNWLNVLLTPPKDLDCRNVRIDVAKMWEECRNREVEKAPTREQASSTYNTSHLLQSLRRAAGKLYRSPEMITVLSKCHGMVANNKFTIRADKDLHRDVGLQKEILRLFFCYNPLWLRVGLEQVYGVHIPLRSNADVLGLSKFLMAHFFNSQRLLRKYKHKAMPQYATEMKKESLVKFLSLAFFLDRAKAQKLIAYDPCLFGKGAPIKESRELLLRFASELLFAVGDVTKPLRHVGYVLRHKQTFIHEFEYGVEDLGSDLKDGVRLTRVMEIILLEPHLTSLLRVPAISRLQKIHNVKLAFDALLRAQYAIEGHIEPKDIVEGHREKTLSFLWQIIYKFQSPRFTKAVVAVQLWWRSAVVRGKLDALRVERERERHAAAAVQRWYRRHLFRRRLERLIPQVTALCRHIKRHNAAVRIQAQYRAFACRQRYLRLRRATLVIQRGFRTWYRLTRMQMRHKRQNAAACTIQSAWRSYSARKRFLLLKRSVAVISALYAATRRMRECRASFSGLRTACILAQRWYRATLLMRAAREEYVRLRSAVCAVQARWRAKLRMRRERSAYLELWNAVVLVQTRFRAQIAMRCQCRMYGHLRRHVLNVQKRFRANKIAGAQRAEYLELRRSVLLVQRRFRATLIARNARCAYIALVSAAVVVQRKFRARMAMQQQRNAYLELRQRVVYVQRQFRALRAMKQRRAQYLMLRNATLFVQRRLRAKNAGNRDRERFIALRNAALVVQARYRARRRMQLFRAAVAAEKSRRRGVRIKHAVLVIEAWFVALKLARRERERYLRTRSVVLAMQARVRGFLARRRFEAMNDPEAREQRRVERLRKAAAIRIQAAWRGHCVRSRQPASYVQMRHSLDAVRRKCKPEDTLRSRTFKNLLLITSERVSMLQWLRAAQEFERMSRLCPHTCVSLSKRSRCEALYDLMLSSCRSRVDVELSSAIAGVLVNIAKCEQTSRCAWLPSRMEQLIRLMVGCCDKESDLFPKLATLLWVLGHDAHQRAQLRALPNFAQLMGKMRALCERQQKMVSKCYRGRQVSAFAAYSAQPPPPLPLVKPDWGLDYPHAPYMFTNSVHGIHSLCALFGV